MDLSLRKKKMRVEMNLYQNIGVEFKTCINDPNDTVHEAG